MMRRFDCETFLRDIDNIMISEVRACLRRNAVSIMRIILPAMGIWMLLRPFDELTLLIPSGHASITTSSVELVGGNQGVEGVASHMKLRRLISFLPIPDTAHHGLSGGSRGSTRSHLVSLALVVCSPMTFYIHHWLTADSS